MRVIYNKLFDEFELGQSFDLSKLLNVIIKNERLLDGYYKLPLPIISPYGVNYHPIIQMPMGDVNSCNLDIPPIPQNADESLSLARKLNDTLHLFTSLATHLPKKLKGRMNGVPIAVKDMTRVKGFKLTGGSRSGEEEVSKIDAPPIANLRADGFAFLGMANLHELAFGATSNNIEYGLVVNPRFPKLTVGGSSGGSAAIIGADVTRVTIGTDTGGSIRIPAACCGVVGFKPTFGAIDTKETITYSYSMDHIGPLGKYVSDCAQAFTSMLGYNEEPLWAFKHADLSRLRIGRLRGYFEKPSEKIVTHAMDYLCSILIKNGADLENASIELAHATPDVARILSYVEGAASNAYRLNYGIERLGADVRRKLETGVAIPGILYIHAQQVRQKLAEELNSLFEHFDILICPTLRSTVPPVGARRVLIGGISYPLYTVLTDLTRPFNLSGNPVVSLPIYDAKMGPAISCQIIGPLGGDWKLLGLADLVERLVKSNSSRQ